MTPPTALPVLDVSDIAYSVADRALLSGAGLSLPSGSSASVMGPSGSGKSTLLMCLLGLIRPTAGTIAIAGTDITGLSAKALTAHRRKHMGMVFQFGELLPELTPVENVMLAALLSGEVADAARDRAESLLAELNVSTSAATGALSGGERQRVAVARALVNEPTVLLADEPTGSLDSEQREAVADLLFAMPRSHGCALVVVTHDAGVAARADVQLRLVDGRLIRAEGPR
ncbi:ABC transporter ATP-binding protein [Streptomyces jumonjinensis]|uniref:ABC transporter ATP-binding protein n=1 Tax=Streptomyces jumonjinensis TaxID=1945 RepID=UPI0037BC39A0